MRARYARSSGSRLRTSSSVSSSLSISRYFGAIDAPDWTRGDHMTPLKKALEHEQYVTSLINGIYAAAYDDRDFRTMQLLDWFVKEQGEEEKNAADLITKMELFGTDAKGLYMLNSELKARVYVAPSLVL